MPLLFLELARRFHTNNSSQPELKGSNKYGKSSSSNIENNLSKQSLSLSGSVRQARKQRHSIANCSHQQFISNMGNHSNSEVHNDSGSSGVQTFNHNLFNDTTRLRRTPKRPSLSNMFSHEEPLPRIQGNHTKPTIRFFSPCRPKEPPPPPPPVATVLTPITPPKQFSPFELKRINDVINGGDVPKNQRYTNGISSDLNQKRHALYDKKHETIQEEDDDEINDEFSTDEFSEDEFGTDEEENSKNCVLTQMKSEHNSLEVNK